MVWTFFFGEVFAAAHLTQNLITALRGRFRCFPVETSTSYTTYIIMLFWVLWACFYASASFGVTFKVGQKFQIILSSIPNLTASPKVVPGDAPVFDIDLFDTDADTIAGLKSQGKTVICYFSAGTYEPWRPDAGNFTDSDKGQSLAPEWPDEYWLRTNNTNVRRIMTNRIQLAAAKGCDAVDPDNTGM